MAVGLSNAVKTVGFSNAVKTFYPGVGSLPLLGRLSNAVGQHSHHHHVRSLQGEDVGDGGEGGGDGGESGEDGGDDKYL